jgi:hypothetical protein
MYNNFKALYFIKANKLEQINYPQKTEYSVGLIRDWLHEFAFPEQFLDVLKISIDEQGAKLAEAYQAVINPQPQDRPADLVYTIDMDDTLVKYTEAKAGFHGQVKQKILKATQERYGLEPDLIDKLLGQINKAARVLPQSSIHPEAYSPTLEIISLTYLISWLQQAEPREAEEFVAKLRKKSAITNNNWIRQFIVKPAIENILPANILEARQENDKTYFVKTGLAKCLATSVNSREIAVFQSDEQLNFSSEEQRQLFINLYLDFQSIMLAPKINLGLIPGPEDKGRFVLATFGEDRFQLIKVRNFLKQLQLLGLRLPDEIIFFSEGRKEPVLTHMFKERSKQVKEYKQIHIDNSLRQIQALNQADIVDMETILFDPQRHKSFKDLLRRP